MSATDDTEFTGLADARLALIQVTVATAVILALTWALGGVFNPTFAFIVFLGLLILTVIVQQSGELSVPFFLSFFAILALLAEFVLPDVIVNAFAPLVGIVETATGINTGAIDPVQFAVLAFTGMIVYWAVSLRLKGGRGGAKNIDTIAKRIFGYKTRSGKLDKLVSRYVTATRAVVGFFVTVLFALGLESGILLGQVGGALSNQPLVTSNVVAIIGGYLALGGPLPFIGYVSVPVFGRIGAAGFLLVTVVVLLIAIAVKFNND